MSVNDMNHMYDDPPDPERLCGACGQYTLNDVGICENATCVEEMMAGHRTSEPPQ